MKRKLMKIAIVVAIAIVSGINVFNAQKSEVLSDVAMANVEALADYEDNNSSNMISCCDQQDVCQGNFCGTFIPAGGTEKDAKKMYYK